MDRWRKQSRLGHASGGAAEARELRSVEKEVLLSSSRAASGRGSRRDTTHLDAGEMDCYPGLTGEAIQRW